MMRQLKNADDTVEDSMQFKGSISIEQTTSG